MYSQVVKPWRTESGDADHFLVSRIGPKDREKILTVLAVFLANLTRNIDRRDDSGRPNGRRLGARAPMYARNFHVLRQEPDLGLGVNVHAIVRQKWLFQP